MSVSSDNNSGSTTTSSKPRNTRRVKVVLRRLPHGMTEPELTEQLEPLPASVSRRWFRAADCELLPFAFSRAYLVFDSEPNAIGFCERFNGYVFVDKLGNESMAIAEQAPFPDVPKRRDISGERDRRMNTLNNDAEYQKFLMEYNSAVVRRVTDFDGLLRDIDERHRAERLVKPTPLTEYVERHLTGRLDRRAAARGGGGRLRAERPSGRSAGVVASTPTKKGSTASRRDAKSEWATETAPDGCHGGEPLDIRDTPRRRDRRKKPVKTEGGVVEEPPAERKRILRRNEDRPTAAGNTDTRSAAMTEAASLSASDRRRLPKSRVVEPQERREAGSSSHRGPRFSDRMAQHQQLQQQQASFSSAATAAASCAKNMTIDGPSIKASDSENNENRRRRERRRWSRGEKPTAGSGGAGGIAVAVLRSLKAERSAQPGT